LEDKLKNRTQVGPYKKNHHKVGGEEYEHRKFVKAWQNREARNEKQDLYVTHGNKF
jgi:hypothetical protein